MSDQSLKDDISFMRRLAEQGRGGPLMGGIFLAAAGLIYGTASLVQWGTENGYLPFAKGNIGDLWIGASVLFALVWLLLFLRLRKAGAASGAAQFAFGTAWAGSGLGIVVMVGALAIVSGKLHNPSLMELNPSIAFAFYGVAWSVSGALARQYWMFAVTVAAFAITLLLALVIGTPYLSLVLGIGLFATLLVPGIKLALPAAG